MTFTSLPHLTVSLSWPMLAFLFGALGGLINAVSAQDLRCWPSIERRASGERRALRVGLLANLGLGAVAAAACVFALAGLGSFVPRAGQAQVLALMTTSLCLGFGTARLATNEADKRLLHEAVCKASAAPAAPPDTVRALETAPPWTVYQRADELMPPPIATWRVGR